MNKKKHFHSLVALALVIMMVVPAALGVASNAAAKKTPGTVTLTKISAPAYNKVKVEWKKTSNATHYKIYYRKAGTSKWSGVKTVSGTANSYTHTSSSSKPIVVGQKYEYTVKGYNSASKASGKYNTKGLAVQTLPSTVKLNSAKLNSAKDAVTVSWNKAAGCNYYLVYRKTGSSGWKKIATVKNSVLSYTDNNPVKGEKNIYTVKGYYSATKASGKYDTKGISVSVPKPSSGTVKVKEVIISDYAMTLDRKHPTGKLSATVAPSNATNKNIVWAVSGLLESVEVDSNGNVRIKDSYLNSKEKFRESGNVFARSAEDSRIYDACYVKVDINNNAFDDDGFDREDIASYPEQILKMVNQERAKYNCAPLELHPLITKAAMIRAKELEQSFSHTRPAGKENINVLNEVGVGGSCDENIAMGQGTPHDVMEDWVESPGHHHNMLYDESRYLGVGFYEGKNGHRYWVQLFTEKVDTNKYPLHLDTQGGSQIEQLYYLSGQRILLSEIPVPVKDGYAFLGWSDISPQRPNANPLKYLVGGGKTTYYALWEKI